VNILIADDSPATRKFVASVLRADGHTVAEARDGGQALELMALGSSGRGEAPDLLLVDVLMPKVSGIFVLSALRNLRVRTPVVLMTVLADRSVYVVAQRLGASGVLYKPFGAQALRDKIAPVLRLSQWARATPFGSMVG
jgi:DNA-binding response OmpR family regulator